VVCLVWLLLGDDWDMRELNDGNMALAVHTKGSFDIAWEYLSHAKRCGMYDNGKPDPVYLGEQHSQEAST